MALIFSRVTLSSNNDKVEFLASGIPQSANNLEGWIAYEDFMQRINFDQNVTAHAEAYLYGEGGSVKATPEEVAYLTERCNDYECFLSERCDNISESNFIIERSVISVQNNTPNLYLQL